MCSRSGFAYFSDGISAMPEIVTEIGESGTIQQTFIQPAGTIQNPLDVGQQTPAAADQRLFPHGPRVVVRIHIRAVG